MMLFLIFLFVDISVIGIFYAVYGRKRKYSEGMLMGVHLPESAACGEEVRRMMERYHARTKKFYLWNLAAVYPERVAAKMAVADRSIAVRQLVWLMASVMVEVWS